MNKEQKFELLLGHPDDESYAEYLKLSPGEKREYEQFTKARAEKFNKLTMDANLKANELEGILSKTIYNTGA